MFNNCYQFTGVSIHQMFEQGKSRSTSAVAEPESTPVPKPFKRQKAEEATKGTSIPVKETLIKKCPEPDKMPNIPVTKLSVKDSSSGGGISTRFFSQTSTWSSLQQSRMVIIITSIQIRDF